MTAGEIFRLHVVATLCHKRRQLCTAAVSVCYGTHSFSLGRGGRSD